MTEALHSWGVLLPYALIATALLGLLGGAVKDAVAAGAIPPVTRVLPREPSAWLPGLLRRRWPRGVVPTVPLAYALSFVAVAFIYACVLDRYMMREHLGADPHAGHPLWALVLLVALSVASVVVVGAGYTRLRALTRLVIDRSARTEAAEGGAERQAAAFAAAYVRLVERSPLNLVVYDRGYTDADGAAHDAGRLLAVSRGAAEALGYDYADLADLHLGEILHPDDVPRVVAAVEAAARGEAAGAGFRCRYKAGPRHRAPGSWLTLEWDPARTVEAAVEGVPAERVEVSSFRDVTAEVAAEAAAAAEAEAEASRRRIELLDARTQGRLEGLGEKTGGRHE